MSGTDGPRANESSVWLWRMFPHIGGRYRGVAFRHPTSRLRSKHGRFGPAAARPGEGKGGGERGTQPSDARRRAARTTAVQSPGANFRLVARVAALFLRAGMEGTGRDFKIPAKARRCCLIF